MPDNEQQIYTLPNEGTGWKTGDVITADKMNAIGNVLHNTSAEVANAVNENIDSEGPNNDILARKLDGLVKYFDTDQTISDNDSRLQYNRMYVQKMPENQEEIIVPKQSEYLQFKANFVSPFSKANNYTVGAYVEYNDKVYKVLAAISANTSAADDATAWNAIASGSIREINVMQELDNLINVYSGTIPSPNEQNRIWIQQQSNSVQVPSMEDFNDLKSAMNFMNNVITTTWEEGSLKTADGTEDNDNANRSYRSDYIDLHYQNIYIVVPADGSVSTRIFFYYYDSATGQYVHGTHGNWNATSRITNNKNYRYCRLLIYYTNSSTTRDEALKSKVGLFKSSSDGYRGKIGLMGVTSFGACLDEGYYSFESTDLPNITDKPDGITTGGILINYKHISGFSIYQIIYDLYNNKYERHDVNDPFVKVNIDVDETLTVSDAAAESAAVGTAFSNLRDTIRFIHNGSGITWVEGTIDGSNIPSSRSYVSSIIDVHGRNLYINVPANGSVTTRVYFYEYDADNDTYINRAIGSANAASRSTTNNTYRYCRILLYYTDNTVARDAALKDKVYLFFDTADAYRGAITAWGATAFSQCSEEGYYSFKAEDLGNITDKPASLTTGGILITYKHFATFTLYQEIYDLYKNKYVRHRADQDFIKVYDTVSDSNHYFVHTCVDKPIDLSSGKGLFIFGDSITTNTHGGFTWGSIVATKTGCIEHNYGVGGYSFVNGDKQVSRIIDQINGVPTAEWALCDICIVAAGTNDVGKGTTPAQLKVGVQDVIDTLKENAPNAKIIFITPIQRGTDYGDSYMKNNELPWIAGVISNIALMNGCSVINGFDCPIPYETNDIVTTLTEDGTHPNVIGKKVYAQFVMNALL